MNHPRLVGHLQRLGQRQADRRRLARRHRLTGKPCMEAPSLDVIADDEELIVLATDFMDADDVRVLDLRGRPGLVQQWRDLLERPPPRDLQRDNAPQLRIARLPDRPETPLPKPLEQFEMANPATGVHGRLFAGQGEVLAAVGAGERRQCVVGQFDRRAALGAADGERAPPLRPGGGPRGRFGERSVSRRWTADQCGAVLGIRPGRVKACGGSRRALIRSGGSAAG